MSYVFISYSSRQQKEADSLRRCLQENGISTWMAPYDIPEGTVYSDIINQAIEGAACVALLLTEDAQNSTYVDKEIERALHYGKTIAPIQLDNVILNDSFTFYLCNQQIMMVRSINQNSRQMKKLLRNLSRLCGADPAGVGDARVAAAAAAKKVGNGLMIGGLCCFLLTAFTLSRYNSTLAMIVWLDFWGKDIPSVASIVATYATLAGCFFGSFLLMIYGWAWKHSPLGSAKTPRKLFSVSQWLLLCAFLSGSAAWAILGGYGASLNMIQRLEGSSEINPADIPLLEQIPTLAGAASFVLLFLCAACLAAAVIRWFSRGGLTKLRSRFHQIRMKG